MTDFGVARRALYENRVAGHVDSLFERHGSSHAVEIPDAIIAATAEHHGLKLATLNVKHFPMFPKLKRAY